MTKTKTARLSLTMPGPIDASQEPVRPVATNPVQKSNSPSGMRRPNERPSDPKRNGEARSRDIYAKSSSPPRYQTSSTSDRPRSPTTPTSPSFNSSHTFSASTEPSSRHIREQSRSFFANLKASKSSAKIQPPEPTIRKVPQEGSTSEENLKRPNRTKSTPDLRGANSSEPVPDLPSLDSNPPPSSVVSMKPNPNTIPRRPVGNPIPSINTSKSQHAVGSSSGMVSPIETSDTRKNGKLFHNFMKRNHSGYSSRGEESNPPSKPSTPTVARSPEIPYTKPPSRDRSQPRNPSPHMDTDNDYPYNSRSQLKDQKSQSFRDGTGANLFSGLKQTTARAAEGIGKAHTRFFRQNKQHSYSNQHQAEYLQDYKLKIINLNLVEQTRLTRIAKRLEDSKDKTEFWMPALPWRCIDFLNFTGCETEGLYRVPGSEREVKMWKQRFDQDYDVNLFDEEDLYDVNTVGSLFKAWLRELPEEVFPLKIQEELSIAYGSEEKAPQKLRDVLSELPPWNYYLLFAITCHLSLLHAYQDKNKMTYQNLYICFAPALKMNGDCFRWLVADWRNCWKGCVTEKRYLEEEYRQIDALSSQQDHHFVAHREKEPSLSSTGSTEFRQPKPESSYHQKQHSQQKNILRSARDTTTSKAQPTRDQFKENSSSHTRLTSGREGSTSNANLTVHPNNTAMANLSLAPQKPSSSESKHHGTDSNDDEEGADASTANDAGPKINLPAAHSRSASQLPELEFPQPISPLFPSNH